MKNLTPAEIKQAVLDQVFDSCMNDADYLANLIEWAHRDYKNEDYANDYIAMGLKDR